MGAILDPTTIKTQDQARDAWMQGAVAKMLLMPEAFGGDDRPQNVIYVTHEGADLLEEAHEELFDAVRQGMLEVSIVPGYRDDSVLAATLTLTAVKPGTTLEFRRVVVLL